MFASLEKVKNAVREVLREIFPDKTKEKEAEIKKLREEIEDWHGDILTA